MSFILDALKKSENDRQDSAPAEFKTVSSGVQAPSAPRWLWVLGGLLLLNTIVLAFLLLKPDSQVPMVQAPAAPAPAASAPANPMAPATTAANETASADKDFSARVEQARRDRPSPAPTDTRPGAAVPEPATMPVAAPPPRAAERRTLMLPTLTQLRADGSVSLPEMHLDIHVYSEVPEDRFVFINMNKYRERSDTKEGPRVDEITPEGVILAFQGTTFLLPRE